MALLGKKNKKEVVVAEKASTKAPAKEKAVSKAVAKAADHSGNHSDFSSLLMRPRVTEKASLLAEQQNVFTFEVAKNANKETIFKAIVDVYKVTPVKISIAQTPSKNVFSRGKAGVQGGVKKAYVYLKKGDKIELI